MASVQTAPAWPAVRIGALGEAWRLYRRHWKVWSVTMLSSVVCVALGFGLTHAVLDSSGRQILPILVTAMIAGFFLGGMTRMAVNQIRGRAPRVEDLFSVSDVWFDLVLGSALVGLLTTIGLELFVVPGVLVLGLFMFMLPLIVDGRLPATGAMIRSFEATRGQWLMATVALMVYTLVAVMGFAGLGIGLLVTGPLLPLSLAVVYSDLFLNPDATEWSKPHDFSERY
jgi:hypothetical protein